MDLAVEDEREEEARGVRLDHARGHVVARPQLVREPRPRLSFLFVLRGVWGMGGLRKVFKKGV